MAASREGRAGVRAATPVASRCRSKRKASRASSGTQNSERRGMRLPAWCHRALVSGSLAPLAIRLPAWQFVWHPLTKALWRHAGKARPAFVPRLPLEEKGIEGQFGRSNPTPQTLHTSTYTLQPTPYTLHPAPDTLHPTPYTPHQTPNTLHPTPYTLHPTPYTLHQTPYTLHPTP